MIAALVAIAAAWVLAGWWTYRTSRRTARLWSAAALVLLAGTQGAEIVLSEAPWWPLIDQTRTATDWFAVIDWIAALALVFCARQRGRQAGMAILACGIAAFVFGLAAGSIGHSSGAGGVCLGQSQSIGSSTVTLHRLMPITDAEYTGVVAALSLRSGDASASDLRPDLRSYIAGAGPPHAGSAVLSRWNGELLAEVREVRALRDCIDLRLVWRPFAQWLRYGAWLGLAGALLLFAESARSAWWRAAAWERIAMRLEDREPQTALAAPARLAWQPLAIALALGFAGLVWQLRQDPAGSVSKRTVINGAAMIKARQSLFGGPRSDDRWIVTADALARHGQFGDAAGMLLGAVENQPGNAEAWLALGDALYGHAEGSLVPAVQLAYDRADRAVALPSKSASLVASAMARSGRGDLAQEWLSLSEPAHQRPAP